MFCGKKWISTFWNPLFSGFAGRIKCSSHISEIYAKCVSLAHDTQTHGMAHFGNLHWQCNWCIAELIVPRRDVALSIKTGTKKVEGWRYLCSLAKHVIIQLKSGVGYVLQLFVRELLWVQHYVLDPHLTHGEAFYTGTSRWKWMFNFVHMYVLKGTR